MNTEKPDWMKLKKLHDAEIETYSTNGRNVLERPKSAHAVYGPSESNVDQVGDGLVDVNHIMKRFDKMPTLEQLQAAGVPLGQTFTADFIDAPDYERAVQIANAANDQFMLLPASIRGRFENQPSQFLAFMSNPANKEEIIRMGLANPDKPKPEPEVTLKDVRDAITGAAKTKKPAGKGGESGED